MKNQKQSIQATELNYMNYRQKLDAVLKSVNKNMNGTKKIPSQRQTSGRQRSTQSLDKSSKRVMSEHNGSMLMTGNSVNTSVISNSKSHNYSNFFNNNSIIQQQKSQIKEEPSRSKNLVNLLEQLIAQKQESDSIYQQTLEKELNYKGKDIIVELQQDYNSTKNLGHSQSNNFTNLSTINRTSQNHPLQVINNNSIMEIHRQSGSSMGNLLSTSKSSQENIESER